MDFCCPNTRCRRGESPLCVKIPNEMLMDEQNMATLFCPQCHGPLVRCAELMRKQAGVGAIPCGCPVAGDLG